jgi:hypothetical protein
MRFFIFLFLLTASLSCFGQDDQSAVPFVAYWSIGDSYDFKVTKINKQWKDHVLSKNDSTSYIVNFKVIDSTESSYRIKWVYQTDFSQFNIPDEFTDKFSQYKLTEVIYLTNEFGEFIEIENWQEISKMIKSLMNDYITILTQENESIDKERLLKSIQPLKAIYDSQEAIELIVFKEIQYFHFPFGVELPVDEKTVYEDLLPNMLGGEPIRGNTALYFKEVDFDESYCLLIQEMNLNKDDTKELLLTFFRQIEIAENELSQAVKSAKFEITDYNEFEFYFFPGVPIKIETKRESLIDIQNEKARGLETVRIQFVE